MRSTDAYCLLDTEVRSTVEFAQTYARKLESLGRAQFDWPLSNEEIRRVQQLIPETNAKRVKMYCRGCALRIIRSPQVAQ